MSWTIPTIKREPVARAREMVAQMSAPQTIKDYISLGIDGLVAAHGESVFITVDGYGHVCSGPGSYDVTTATLSVRPDKD